MLYLFIFFIYSFYLYILHLFILYLYLFISLLLPHLLSQTIYPSQNPSQKITFFKLNSIQVKPKIPVEIASTN